MTRLDQKVKAVLCSEGAKRSLSVAIRLIVSISVKPIKITGSRMPIDRKL